MLLLVIGKKKKKNSDRKSQLAFSGRIALFGELSTRHRRIISRGGPPLKRLKITHLGLRRMGPKMAPPTHMGSPVWSPSTHLTATSPIDSKDKKNSARLDISLGGLVRRRRPFTQHVGGHAQQSVNQIVRLSIPPHHIGQVGVVHEADDSSGIRTDSLHKSHRSRSSSVAGRIISDGKRKRKQIINNDKYKPARRAYLLSGRLFSLYCVLTRSR